MDGATLAVTLAAVIAAIGAAVKAIYDVKRLKQWICTRQPCKDRLSSEPPPS